MSGRFLHILLAALALIMVPMFGVAAAGEVHSLPDDLKRPVRVHVSFRLLNIMKVQETVGELSAVIELRQTWADPSLKFDGVKAGRQRLDFAGDDAKAKLADIWTPALLIENQIGAAQSVTSSISIYADGRIQLIQHVEGNFRFAKDVSAFPFDTQRIPFALVPQYHPADEVLLVVDDGDRALSTLSQELTVTDWTPTTLSFRAENFYGWNARPFARLSAEVDLSRNWPRYVLRIFVPFLAVLSVSMFILWGAVKEPPNITYSALLALSALGFTFESSFPGSMSSSSPIALMISIGYFYLIVTLLVDLLMNSQSFPLRQAFPHLAIETRRVVRHLLPALFLIICGCVILRSLG